MSEALAATPPRGSVLAGMLVMLLLSVLLFWLPVVGSLIAGVVGGKIAAGLGRALWAALLPSVVLGVGLFFLGTLLTGLPVVGVVFGIGGLVLAVSGIGTLLLGAAIGGLLA